MTHPIPTGRQAALYDKELWVPLAGIVSRIMKNLGLDDRQAGDLITSGMQAGEIGHKTENGNDWIVTPRAAELVKLSGFDYETMIAWSTGTLYWAGRGSRSVVLVFWPDVERAARGEAFGPTIDGELVRHPPKVLKNKPSQPEVDTWLANYYSAAGTKGHPPPKRDVQAFPDCRTAIGATEKQMRLAILKIPLEHRRRRGDRDG